MYTGKYIFVVEVFILKVIAFIKDLSIVEGNKKKMTRWQKLQSGRNDSTSRQLAISRHFDC
jgi:hypothetical protein